MQDFAQRLLVECEGELFATDPAEEEGGRQLVQSVQDRSYRRESL